MNCRIEGQFYNYELVKFTVSPETEFQIYKIVRKLNKTLLNILSSGKITKETFNSWVNESDIKKI